MNAKAKSAQDSKRWSWITKASHSEVTRRAFLRRSAAAAAVLGMPGFGVFAAEGQGGAERERIEKAIPSKAIVRPLKPRKLLIFDLNVNYGGHGSIPTANLAFTLMGEKTGAWTTMVSRDPAVFKPESLRQFDAVFFNNNVGNLFTDPELRQSLVDFVYGGGGMLGVHGTSVAFTQWPGAVEDWPEFGIMLGARGANHKDSTEHVFFKFDEPGHALNAAFGGKAFDYRDEFFRVHGPYSRERVRVLFSIDNEKTPNEGQARGNTFRQDNDYALAWVRQYGRGRTFYCTIAHNPYVFWDPTMLQFYMGAIQFALGDLPASTIPSAKIKPALLAQERLGWRLGLMSHTFLQHTFSEAVGKATELGLTYIEGNDFQGVGHGVNKPFNYRLTNDDLREVRLRLDEAGVRLLSYRIRKAPPSETEWRQLFEFGRKLGIETFIGEASAPMDLVEKLCDEHEINFALHKKFENVAPTSREGFTPEEGLKLCEGRSKRVGICGNMAFWIRVRFAPVRCVRTLGQRLLYLQLHDHNVPSSRGHDVPWGTGAGRLRETLTEIQQMGIKPTFGLEFPDGTKSMADMAESVKFFNKTSLELDSKK